MFDSALDLIKGLYPSRDKILLHEPVFLGNEKEYLAECIDSTFVSYVGPFVEKFEGAVKDYTGSPYAKAMINGTTALHIALIASGVVKDDLVLTQSLTFVATANAISYCHASPVFIDVSSDNLGMSPDALSHFIENETERRGDDLIHKKSGRRIACCLPVHVLGHSCAINEIAQICKEQNLFLIEDAAEAMGSYNGENHLGTLGDIGVLSFNGNKTITTGCGGMVLTKDEGMIKHINHLSTTAKKSHAWEFDHDEVGYNYRMSNVSAAIGLAQMETLDQILKSKRETASEYANFFRDHDAQFIEEPEGTHSNYWLNGVKLSGGIEQLDFLKFMNENHVNCRPLWKAMHELPMYSDCIRTELSVTEDLCKRIVNLPSGFR